MKQEWITWVPWIGIFLLSVLLMMLIHRRFVERNVWGRIVKKYKDNVDLKVLLEAQFVSRFGAIENHSLLYKLDRLILMSGVKHTFPFVSGEVFLGAMSILALAGVLEGMMFFQNILVALFLAAAQVAVLYVIVIALAGKTYNRIEDDMAIFISILSNHAKGSSDIVSIMQNTIPSLSGPMRGIVEKFVMDAEHTGNVDIAFDYMKESVDNRQLQTIIMNLKNCMHYQANYEEVLVQMMGQVAAGLSAREDRKNILYSMKLTLVAISITAIIIVWIIGAGLGIDVQGGLTENIAGQFLLFVTGILYLLVGIKMFKTDK